MVKGFEKIFTFFSKRQSFFKDRTLQDFKGGVATLQLLILILNVIFSCHE